MALTLCVPTENELTTKVALPVVSIAAVPSAMVPSVNVTTPVGSAEVVPVAATVAVRVTLWPKTLGFGLAARVVALGALLTTCETPLDVEVKKLLSPA